MSNAITAADLEAVLGEATDAKQGAGVRAARLVRARVKDAAKTNVEAMDAMSTEDLLAHCDAQAADLSGLELVLLDRLQRLAAA